jgi:hypothetical protein
MNDQIFNYAIINNMSHNFKNSEEYKFVCYSIFMLECLLLYALHGYMHNVYEICVCILASM